MPSNTCSNLKPLSPPAGNLNPFLSRFRLWIFRGLALCLGLILAFFTMEASLRFVNPQTTGPGLFAHDSQRGPIPVPNLKGTRQLPGIMKYSFHNNSLGLRGNKEYPLGHSDKTRILLLGDSFTYGLCVDDSQTFAALLDNSLSREAQPFEVINGGNPATGTDYALKFFQVLGHQFHPDLVLLFFFTNDFVDNLKQDYYDTNSHGQLIAKAQKRPRLFFIDTPLYRWAVSWSHTVNFVRTIIISQRTCGHQKKDPLIRQSAVSEDLDERARYLTRLYLSELKQSVQSVANAHHRFWIFLIPDESSVDLFRKTGLSSPPEQMIRQLAQDLDIPFFSLTPSLGRSPEPLETLYFKEGHWRARAHELAARFVAEKIRTS